MILSISLSGVLLVIADFCRLAMSEKWRVVVSQSRNGWSVSSSREFIQTRRGSRRYWASLDTLVRHLEQASFHGDLTITIQQQQLLNL